MFKTKILIENLFDDEHDVRKNELYDSIKYFVLFRNRARSDSCDCLTDLILNDLEKFDTFWIFCSRDVVEIRCDERKKQELDETLNFCFF
jgi:hypothetical protein